MTDDLRARASNLALVGALTYEHPELLPILHGHLADNGGEVLPYLYVADVMRWLVLHREDRPDVCREVFRWMEAAWDRADDHQRDLIGAGFVEALPNPGEAGAAEMRALLGPDLRRLDAWNPPT
ncbi:DUF7674 family protein [Blastococcus litoris]|uniref:DUF7674 family protein n=1 Tax=Blastococcus litoris TaxID=2171622 RepID=UPI0013E0B761|nr:hypothetical protein [Blastococcus litoris]